MALAIRIFLYHSRPKQELTPGELEPRPPDVPCDDPDSVVAAADLFVNQQHLRGVHAASAMGGTQRLMLPDGHKVRCQIEGCGGHGCGLCNQRRGVADTGFNNDSKVNGRRSSGQWPAAAATWVALTLNPKEKCRHYHKAFTRRPLTSLHGVPEQRTCAHTRASGSHLRSKDIKRATRAGNAGAKAATRGMLARTRVSSTRCCYCCCRRCRRCRRLAP